MEKCVTVNRSLGGKLQFIQGFPVVRELIGCMRHIKMPMGCRIMDNYAALWLANRIYQE